MATMIHGLWDLQKCDTCNCERHYHLNKSGARTGGCRKLWCFCRKWKRERDNVQAG